MFGTRPAATSTASAVSFSPSSNSICTPRSTVCARTGFAFSMTRMPSLSNCFRMNSPTSGSSFGRICAPCCTMVTRTPSRAITWPSSHPIGPPPITTRLPGLLCRLSKIVSFVKYGTSLSPAIFGNPARLPAAITKFLARNLCPATSISCGERKRASPRNTSTPSDSKRSCESFGAIFARRERIRSKILPN